MKGPVFAFIPWKGQEMGQNISSTKVQESVSSPISRMKVCRSFCWEKKYVCYLWSHFGVIFKQLCSSCQACLVREKVMHVTHPLFEWTGYFLPHCSPWPFSLKHKEVTGMHGLSCRPSGCHRTLVSDLWRWRLFPFNEEPELWLLNVNTIFPTLSQRFLKAADL